MFCQWILLTAMFAVCCRGSNICTSGLLDQDLLERRASKIGSTFPGIASTVLRRSQYLVIPGMNFSCSGVITGYLLGVDVRDGTGDEVIVELYRPRVQDGQVVDYNYIDYSQVFIELSSGTYSQDGVLQYNFDGQRFQAGDLIGVYQIDRLDSAVRLFYTNNNPSPPLAFDVDRPYSDTFTVNASGHKLFNGTVLIRPITSNDSCLNGFLSRRELRQQVLEVNINGVVSRPRQQRLFPDIKFTCNGFITKWIVGAQIRTTGITTELPEMQIWRRLGETTYAKVGSSLLTNDVAKNSNVIEYTPVPPVEFQVGDILGVFQPQADHSKTLVYYQHGTGPENYRYTADTPLSTINPTSPNVNIAYDYPLLSVEITQKATPTVRLDKSSHLQLIITVIVAVTAVVVILTVSILIVIILLAVLRHQKYHSPSSNTAVVVDKNVAASRNKVLNMKENANSYVMVEQNKTQYKNITSV